MFSLELGPEPDVHVSHFALARGEKAIDYLYAAGSIIVKIVRPSQHPCSMPFVSANRLLNIPKPTQTSGITLSQNTIP